MAKALPPFLGDMATATWAVMLFPDDPLKARALAIYAFGLYRHELEALGDPFLDERCRAALDNLGPPTLSPGELETRILGGLAVGEVVKILWASVCTCPELASWKRAIEIVAEEMRGFKSDKTKLTLNLKLFGPVQHLWGAYGVRGRTLNTGLHGAHEMEAFLAEATDLLSELRTWRDRRPNRYRATDRLAVIEFGPWEGWTPPPPASDGRPHTIAKIKLVPKHLDMLRGIKGPST